MRPCPPDVVKMGINEEVVGNRLLPPVVDMSSTAIHRVSRRPNAKLVLPHVPSIGKPNWKIDSKHKRNKKHNHISPIDDEQNKERTDLKEHVNLKGKLSWFYLLSDSWYMTD